MATNTNYTNNQFADAVEYLCGATTSPEDRKELLALQGALRGIPKDEHLENLARNANYWAEVVKRNLRLGLPDHRERLAQLIEKLQAHGGL